jgi:hypothetical protein
MTQIIVQQLYNHLNNNLNFEHVDTLFLHLMLIAMHGALSLYDDEEEVDF